MKLQKGNNISITQVKMETNEAKISFFLFQNCLFIRYVHLWTFNELNKN